MNSIKLQGSLVALITPMFEDGSVDYASMQKLIDWHVEQGTTCVVIAGTNGESATLSFEEHAEVVAKAVKFANHRIPVMAGAGANSTQEAIELAKFCKQHGADYTLSVVPYYNKPSQEGIYQHFRAIAEAVDIPVVLYNVPRRTVVSMDFETVVRLAQIPNIIGIKEATDDLTHGLKLIRALSKEFILLSGEDPSAWAMMLAGYHGVVSVSANVVPKLIADLCRAALEGDVKRTVQLQMQCLELNAALFAEPSPAPTKWALAKMRKIEPYLRLPLVGLSTKGQQQLTPILQQLQLI